MDKIIRKLYHRILHDGQEVVVRGLKTKEIIGVDFKVNNIDETNDETVEETEYRVNKKLEVRDQIGKCISLLVRDRNSRQAVIQFNQTPVGKETPNCFVSIQFVIRGDELHAFVFQRSLDVVNKMKGDIRLVKSIAVEIASSTNSMYTQSKWFVGSAHYYIES